MLGTSVEAGIGTFVDSMTASSTLAILLLFGVTAGIFYASADFLNSGSLDVFVIASAGHFSTSVVSAFGCSAAVFGFGTLADSPLASAGAGNSGSIAEEEPSASFGTLAISMYLGRCVKTLIFFPSVWQRWPKQQPFFSFPAFARDSNSLGTQNRKGNKVKPFPK
jgi:hypothetical protein